MTAEAAALAALIERERETLLTEWRQKVRALPDARHLDVPTLNDDVPKLLDELAAALRHPSQGPTTSKPGARKASVEHGAQRAEVGYDIGEVVAEYSMLRGCIHTLALIHGIPLRDGQVHTLNNMVDRAIGIAVQTFAVECELAEKRRHEQHLAFIAHDLRTPLHAVVLATRVLEQNDLPEAERRRMIDLLKRNARQLSQLVESVLEANSSDMSDQRGKPEHRTLQLWPLVEELVGDLQPTADHSVTRIINEVPPDLLVHADAAMLRRIFQNLIRNAIGSAPRGHVRIGARMHEGNGGVSCWISDDGEGLSAERVRQALDTLSAEAARQAAREAAREEEAPSQTGQGLSIVKAFIEAHGGRIEVELAGNGPKAAGSTVRFWLPAKDQRAR